MHIPKHRLKNRGRWLHKMDEEGVEAESSPFITAHAQVADKPLFPIAAILHSHLALALIYAPKSVPLF